MALAWALACAAPALLLVAPGALALTLHVVQKAGFLGAFGVAVVDAAVGAAIGAGVASLGGLLVPWIACVLRARLPVRIMLASECGFRVYPESCNPGTS